MRPILSNVRNVERVRFNLTLVRHGETSANADGIIQGQTDTELSPIGYQQSRALGRYLQNHRFTHVYSSDLRRTSETSAEIMRLNKLSSTCKIQTCRLLRERIFGIAEGRSRQSLKEMAKAKGIAYINFTPDGAETTAEVRQRAITFFHDLCNELIEYRKEQLLEQTTTPDDPILAISSSQSSFGEDESVENLSMTTTKKCHDHK